MILGNIHESDRGRRVRMVAGSTHRRFPAGWNGDWDNVGWLDPQPGLAGTVAGVESHGSNPWTRYGVRFDDGSYAAGLCLGTDIAFI